MADLIMMASKALESLKGKVPGVGFAQLYLTGMPMRASWTQYAESCILKCTGMRASEIKQLRTEIRASYFR
jgi:hypothetical protein